VTLGASRIKVYDRVVDEYLILREKDLRRELDRGATKVPLSLPFLIALLLHTLLVAAMADFFIGPPSLNFVLKRPAISARFRTIRLKYYYTGGEGTGGGGGGGGQRDPRPAAAASGHGRGLAPLAVPAPPVPEENAPVETETPPPATRVPPVAAGGEAEQTGVLPTEAVDVDPVFAGGGSGDGGGIGSGTGSGIGSGSGPGIGPGSGGGTGGGPYRPGGGVSIPKLVHEEKVVYPDAAKMHFTTGVVVLEAVIKADGTVGDIRVIRSLPDGCVGASIEALRKWKFLPGRKDGVPVDVLFLVTFTFG